MKDNYAHLVVVLDRSGSMSSTKQDAIGGFNQFVADQKALPGEATLTLAQFDDQYEVIHKFKDIREVPPLTDETFQPRGSTALLDAIGRTVNEVGAQLAAMPESRRPARVLLAVITDGGENASREFSREKVFDMLKHQQEKYQWAVTFIGSNQDAIAVGGSLCVLTSACLTYTASGFGTRAATKSLSAATARYRSGQAFNYSESDKQAQAAAAAQN